MSTVPLGEEQLDRRVVLVLDLDGQPLTVLAVLEELLADLAAWEESDAADPPHPRAPLRLPAPLAGGVALAAVRRLTAALGPTQCRGCQRGRLLAPDGSHAHPPLSMLTLPSADLALLSATAAALGRPGLAPDLVDVLTCYADRLTEQLARRPPPARAAARPAQPGRAGRADRAHRRPGRAAGSGAHRGQPAAHRPPGGQPTGAGPGPDRRRGGRLCHHRRPDHHPVGRRLPTGRAAPRLSTPIIQNS